MIDLRQLQALRAVHRTGSVTQAARSLGWSQPTVDYHLRNLDALVGGPLLERSTRGSTLTPVGHLLLDRAQEILTLSERALRDAHEFTHMGHARLRFGTFPTAAARLLPGIAEQLADLSIELDAVLEEVAPLVTDVNRRELDAALVYTVPGRELPFRSDVITTEVLRDPLLLALPEGHPLATRASISLDTLLTLHSERWLLGATQNDPMDAVVVDAFADAGHTLEVAIRTDDFQVMLGMIAARMVIGLVAKLAAGPSHPGVVLLPIEDPAFARSVLLAAPADGVSGQPSTAVRQLAVAIRHAVAGLD
ncbi:molybdate transport repressor ModE-like protein [Leucobacter luti]|uniref:LysR family transcriptional regulator n=1 Tax=Leucobacter luti TaxID=340320 RepID=UPI00104D6B67|nr:LysR family transcriptional regulator [Leucobacter luti]MCW2288196.1 molybdate transport repressor ModE-like protein [Leucobacter luti]TCK45644.1 molybdate transport repressor ModE-like protein [Leucobacter luti]